MRILFFINKYTIGINRERWYPDFLKGLQVELRLTDHDVSFVYFGEGFQQCFTGDNLHAYNKFKIFENDDIVNEAHRIERDYKFTFKQAYYPDILQTSKFQNTRKINLPQVEFNNTKDLVSRFLFLEKLFSDHKYDACIVDQSPELEYEYGRALCLHFNKIFLRHSVSFLGKSVFFQQYKFGKERVVNVYNENLDSTFNAQSFIDDFVRNSRPPYKKRKEFNQEKKLTIIDSIFKYIKVLINFSNLFSISKRLVFSVFYWMEENFLKRSVESSYNEKLPYIFFGLHKPIEGSITLRGLPYMNQASLIESISRILPVGMYLYVREHPSWKSFFPYSFLADIAKLPNVRVIPTYININNILKNSKAVMSYNATTGIEALMHGKAVLSFCPNVYTNYHPSAIECYDLFELGEKVVELVNLDVNYKDTCNYIDKFHRISDNINLNSNCFFSKDDANLKSVMFSGRLIKAINWCKRN